MGAGASTKDVEKHVVLENVFQMIHKCIRDLPFPQDSITEDVIRKVSSKAERIELLSEQEVIKKGQRSKGIYILLRGEVEVLTSNSNALATLLPGDIFGEISTLFYIPCTATVKTKTKCLLILLKTENLQSSLNDNVVNVDLATYYVSKRYLDTNGTLSQAELMHRIAVSVLKQVPVFQNWEESAIESLVQKTETDTYESLVIFAEGSMIQQAEQPADEITIIARGSVEILDGSGKQITKFNARRWPIWIGEEVLQFMKQNSTKIANGLYSKKDRHVGIKAVTVCEAIIIKYSHIVDISERYTSGAGLTLKKTLDQWSRLYEHWTPELFEKYQPYLQIETILKFLGDFPLLQNVPVSFLYALVMSSSVHEYKEETTIIVDKIKHKANLKRNNSKRKSLKKDSKQKISEVQTVLEPGQIYARGIPEHFKEDDRFLLLFDGVVKVKFSEKSAGYSLDVGKLFYIPSSKMLQCSVVIKSKAIFLRFTGSTFFSVCQTYPKAILNLPNSMITTSK